MEVIAEQTNTPKEGSNKIESQWVDNDYIWQQKEEKGKIKYKINNVV